MILINIFTATLPISDPVLKFLLILAIILFVPIILNKVKIPHLLGLIIAGAIIGPHGFNLLLRDSSIILSGTAGLLYIMFLAGLEIDLTEFKKNSLRSVLFGLYCFIIPMVLGIFSGLYLLKFSLLTSILMASMFASHTLIAYPILSKLGIIKNRAVTISVGGTMITDTLALLVLAVVVQMTKGAVDSAFWIKLTTSILLFGLTVSLLFPIIARWFFKHFKDNVSQYIFVLVLVFLGAVLAELAGVDAIIGAFIAGLSLNRLIPSTSPLMNRIDFVGNAIFIPFFLISVGMLVDFRAFVQDFETLKVAAVMTTMAVIAKYTAAWLTQKSFGMTADERRVIFGLNNAHAAATLAIVMVGYNVILGYTPAGDPIRLFNESILNGAIIMILITCTIATIMAQKGGKNIALSESSSINTENRTFTEKILIPVSNPDRVEELITLSTIIKAKATNSEIFALSVINNSSVDDNDEQKAHKVLNQADMSASSVDLYLKKLLRYDINTANGIVSVVKEQSISDLVLGLNIKNAISDSLIGKLSEDILSKCNVNTYIYRPMQPIATVKRHLIVIPSNAEKEVGFPFWLAKVWNISRNTGAKIVIYSNPKTARIVKDIHSKHFIDAEFKEFNNWADFLILSREVKPDDSLFVILSRENKVSFNESMRRIPILLTTYFGANSFILVYPKQYDMDDNEAVNLNNPSMLEPIEKIDEIGKTVAKLFKKKDYL